MTMTTTQIGEQDYTNASNISPSPTFQLNPLPGKAPDMSMQFSDIAGLSKSLDSELKARDQAVKDFQTQSQEQESSMWDKLSGAKTISQTQEDYFNQLGIKPKDYFDQRTTDIAELESLQKSYNDLSAQKDRALLNEENRMASMGFIGKKMTQTEKEWNIRLNQAAAGVNLKLGIMQARNENFTQATNYVNQAVANYTADLNLEIQQFNKFEQDNYNQLKDLKQEYKDTFSAAKEIALKQYDTENSRATQVGNMIAAYPDAPWPSNALDLSLTEAAAIKEKSQKYQKEMTSAGSNPLLDAIRMMTLTNLQSQFMPSPGQLVFKNTGKIVGNEIPAATRQKIDGLHAYLNEEGNYNMTRVTQLLNQGVKTGPDVLAKWELYKRSGGIFGRAGLTDDQIELGQLLETLNADYIYTRSGAQINEQEIQRLQRTNASMGYDQKTNLTKARTFMGVVGEILNSNMNSYGVQYYNQNQQNQQQDYDAEYQDYLSKAGQVMVNGLGYSTADPNIYK